MLSPLILFVSFLVFFLIALSTVIVLYFSLERAAAITLTIIEQTKNVKTDNQNEANKTKSNNEKSLLLC